MMSVKEVFCFDSRWFLAYLGGQKLGLGPRTVPKNKTNKQKNHLRMGCGRSVELPQR